MGKGIKTTAKVFMFLGIIACCAVIFLGLRFYGDNHVYMMFSDFDKNRVYTQNAEYILRGNQAYYSIYAAIGGAIGIPVCILSLMPFYWCGCLFMRIGEMQKKIDDLTAGK